MLSLPKPIISIDQFLSDPNYIKNCSLFPLQRKIVRDFLLNPYQIGVWCLGRRSGKTFSAGLVSVYCAIALAPIYRTFVRDGENFYILFVATNREQATIALRQVKLFFKSSLILSRFVLKENETSITLNNGAVFKVLPNTAEGVRGYPAPVVILDEAAHYNSGNDKKRTGEQLFQGIEPAIAQFGSTGRLLMISTPWSKQGIFYENYQKGISGNHPEIHSVNYPTWKVNPNISQTFLAAAKKRDPLLFEVEYGANFAVDFAAFFDADIVKGSVTAKEPRAPIRGVRYFLSLDPALSGDAYTACIAHLEKDVLVVDLFHDFVPSFFSSEKNKKVVDIAQVEWWILDKHRSYPFQKIVLDQYQSQATIQRLKRELGDSRVEEFTWTPKSKTEAYSYLKELFNNQKISLYEHEVAIAQLVNLQVYYGAGGKWSVSGGKGLKVDDFCSVLASIALISRKNPRPKWAVTSLL